MLFPPAMLLEIGCLNLETYRNRRHATLARAGQPRTDATVNREISTLRHRLNKAVEWGRLENNPDKESRLRLQENTEWPLKPQKTKRLTTLRLPTSCHHS